MNNPSEYLVRHGLRAYLNRYGNGTEPLPPPPPPLLPPSPFTSILHTAPNSREPRANYAYGRTNYAKRKTLSKTPTLRPRKTNEPLAKRQKVSHTNTPTVHLYKPRGIRKRKVSTLFNKRLAKKRRVIEEEFLHRRRTYVNYNKIKIDELRKKIYNSLRTKFPNLPHGTIPLQVNRLIYNGTNLKKRNGNTATRLNNIIQVFPVSIQGSSGTGHAVGVVKVRDTMYVFDPHGSLRNTSTNNMARKLAGNLGINNSKVIIYDKTSPQAFNTKGVCFGFVTLFLTRITPQLLNLPNKENFGHIVFSQLGKYNEAACNRMNVWMGRQMSYALRT